MTAYCYVAMYTDEPAIMVSDKTASMKTVDPATPKLNGPTVTNSDYIPAMKTNNTPTRLLMTLLL